MRGCSLDEYTILENVDTGEWLITGPGVVQTFSSELGAYHWLSAHFWELLTFERRHSLGTTIPWKTSDTRH